MNNKRDTALDIVRITALFCVISVHFLLNNGFYDVQNIGKSMYVMTLMRTFFMVCVPLFIILTGYLMKDKKLSKSYYKGIIKTLSIYFLASLFYLYVRIIIFNDIFTIKTVVLNILNFKVAEYSWYIEMYIGLFLLIPFINLIYNNLESKKQKQYLILTLLFLTSIPAITNMFNLNLSVNFKLLINNSDTYSKVLPYWWKSIYPLTYYFIGCYIKEYKPQIKKSLNALLLIITVLLFGTYNYLCNYNKLYVGGIRNDWSSIQTVITTVLLFVFILQFKYNFNEKVKKVIKKISDYSLGAYLVSSVFDRYFYTILISKEQFVSDRLIYYFIIVPLVFICSLIISMILNNIYNLLIRLAKKIKTRKLLES